MGRPTKYKPEYCEKVIDLMSQGWAKTEVCYDREEGLGIHFSTFLLWQEKHPEFKAAVEEGQRASEAWWNKTGRVAVLGGIDGFNATTWIFNMKNRFGWADKMSQDHTSSDGSMTPGPTRIEIVGPDDDGKD